MDLFGNSSKNESSLLTFQKQSVSTPERNTSLVSVKTPVPPHSTQNGSRYKPTKGPTGSSFHHKDITRSPSSATALDRKGSKKTPERPPLERRGTTIQTRYVEMLLSLDRIPRLHNIYASFFTWVLLAGYIVFPATFTSLRNNDRLAGQAENGSGIEKKVLDTVRNAPLLYVAGFSCGIGCLGCVWLWWRWRKNYVWVINRIFLPSFMNSIAGLISTIVNIYSAQQGQYSVTAKITVIVTAACSVVTAGLFLMYNNLALERVKKRHDKETREGSYTGGRNFGRHGSSSNDGNEDREKENGQTLVDKMKQKAKEPALEPTSVV